MSMETQLHIRTHVRAEIEKKLRRRERQRRGSLLWERGWRAEAIPVSLLIYHIIIMINYSHSSALSRSFVSMCDSYFLQQQDPENLSRAKLGLISQDGGRDATKETERWCSIRDEDRDFLIVYMASSNDDVFECEPIAIIIWLPHQSQHPPWMFQWAQDSCPHQIRLHSLPVCVWVWWWHLSIPWSIIDPYEEETRGQEQVFN